MRCAQWSVLGPLLFTLYTADIGKVIQQYGLSHHKMSTNYTHRAFHPCQQLLRMKWYGASSLSVIGWLVTGSYLTHQSRRLCGAPPPPRCIHLIDRSSFALPDCPVGVLTMGRIAAFFDECMSMEEHVNRLVRLCFYKLRRIRFIRRSLSIAVATSLTNSFIIARVDYCNSILAGLTKHQTGRIQSILNVAGCVIYGQARFDHITPTLRDWHHWLRLSHRIEFKRCLLMYKAIYGLAPAYITNYQWRSQWGAAPLRQKNKKKWEKENKRRKEKKRKRKKRKKERGSQNGEGLKAVQILTFYLFN